jgi:hypothetical protein
MQVLALFLLLLSPPASSTGRLSHHYYGTFQLHCQLCSRYQKTAQKKSPHFSRRLSSKGPSSGSQLAVHFRFQSFLESPQVGDAPGGESLAAFGLQGAIITLNDFQFESKSEDVNTNSHP